MPRNVEISLPAKLTDELLPKIKKNDGVIGLRVQKGISARPEGDVISFELTNNAVSPFFNMLEAEGILEDDEVYITTTQPVSILSQPSSDKIMREGSESSWEEILNNINHESTMTVNGLLLMFASGFIAVYGISTNTLHIVIGAMLIAPGFKPIARIVLGLITSHKDWKSGVKDTLKGYTGLFMGAAIASLIIKFSSQDLIPGTSSYLEKGELIKYWSQISISGVLVSAAAAVSGAVILATNKSVLTAGVMIALALVPAATITAMGLVEGDYEIVEIAFSKFILEIVIVAFFSALIFLWKRLTTMKRKMRA